MINTENEINTDMILVTNTKYFEIIDHYMKIPQPTTGIEIILTGFHKNMWLLIDENNGITIKDFISLFFKENQGLNHDEILHMLKYLSELSLILIKPNFDW